MLEGIVEGFDRLVGTGALAAMPLVVGVQAAGCAPIAAAFDRGDEAVTAWPGAPSSIASSINDPLRGYADDGTRTLRTLRRVGGLAVAVDDAAITDAMRDLGAREGMAVEPAAATPLAALRALDVTRDVPRPVVLVLSGHVLKDPAHAVASVDDSPVLDAPGALALVDGIVTRRG
jgi:threonine synthase